MSNRSQLVLIFACVAGAFAFVGIQVFRATGKKGYAPDVIFSEQARLTELPAMVFVLSLPLTLILRPGRCFEVRSGRPNEGSIFTARTTIRIRPAVRCGDPIGFASALNHKTRGADFLRRRAADETVSKP